jgi:peroxiredoxin
MSLLIRDLTYCLPLPPSLVIVDMIELQPGHKAPPINGIDQDGNKIALKDYKGKKLILYFLSSR